MNQQIQDLEIQVDTQVQTVTVGMGAKVYEILLWVLGIIPGVIFLLLKLSAESYFKALEQKIQTQAAEIDNYLEQRVMVLENCARLLDRAIDLDKTTFENMTSIKYGSGMSDEARNQLSVDLDSHWNNIHMLVERYPDLRAHDAIQEAMHQNLVLQREITAARTLFNDAVYAWNRDIFQWIVKRIVAAKHRYTTRIPFVASKEVKQRATEVFF